MSETAKEYISRIIIAYQTEKDPAKKLIMEMTVLRPLTNKLERMKTG